MGTGGYRQGGWEREVELGALRESVKIVEIAGDPPRAWRADVARLGEWGGRESLAVKHNATLNVSTPAETSRNTVAAAHAIQLVSYGAAERSFVRDVSRLALETERYNLGGHYRRSGPVLGGIQ